MLVEHGSETSPVEHGNKVDLIEHGNKVNLIEHGCYSDLHLLAPDKSFNIWGSVPCENSQTFLPPPRRFSEAMHVLVDSGAIPNGY